jgi:hypothetical protein
VPGERGVLVCVASISGWPVRIINYDRGARPNENPATEVHTVAGFRDPLHKGEKRRRLRVRIENAIRGVSRLALELLEPELPPTKEGRFQAFKQRRSRIERAASAKFDRGEIEPDGHTVLVRVVDLL